MGPQLELMKRKTELRELVKIGDRITQGCTRCGFCTFFCPVYEETLDESCVARGKIALVRGVLDGSKPMEAGVLDHMDTCLLCKSCVANCPTRVETDRIILAARADGVTQTDLSPLERVFFRHVLPRRKLFGRIVRTASRVQKALPRSEPAGSIRHLPHMLSGIQKGRHIPSISRRFLRDMLPKVSRPPEGVKTKGSVALFAGCGMDFAYPEYGLRMVQFLCRHGIEVHFPKDQGCCGMAVVSRGDVETAHKMATHNAQIFRGHDRVITGCATCGTTLKDYGDRFAGNHSDRNLLESFSKSVVDLNQYVVDFLFGPDLRLEARQRYQGKKVTWHDPCHLARYQGIREQPRRLLKATSHIQFVEMPDADRCCGMGGSFSIYHYDIARKIARKKARAIQYSKADVVVTACPGCIIQLNDALIQRGMPQRAIHIMDLFQ